MELDGCRVLVIEDDYYLADDAHRLLRQAGATVLGPCARLDQCMALLESSPMDCAVVDINLGRGLSFEIPAWLREHGIPFVFVTGYGEDVIAEPYADVERLEKPVESRRLVIAVKRLCRGAT